MCPILCASLSHYKKLKNSSVLELLTWVEENLVSTLIMGGITSSSPRQFAVVDRRMFACMHSNCMSAKNERKYKKPTAQYGRRLSRSRLQRLPPYRQTTVQGALLKVDKYTSRQHFCLG